jgi:hypothetical protein
MTSIESMSKRTVLVEEASSVEEESECAKLLYPWEANPETFAEVLPPHCPLVDCHFEVVWE